jgi:triosephosphate isomerase
VTRRPIVAGNWKMNGSLAANAELIASARRDAQRDARVEVVLCAPSPYLAQLATGLADSPVGRGAQDVSMHASGAYTGEVSAAMLAELGVTHVIVGHSERRALHGETSEAVARKAAAALAAGLIPIVCVGETLAERDAGQTESIVLGQLAPVLTVLQQVDWARVVLAYEPVWAIGTGRTATADQAQAVHASLRKALAAGGVAAGAVRILYGGSVKPGNAAELFAMPDIDGGLIGGASLVAADFSAICDAAQGSC